MSTNFDFGNYNNQSDVQGLENASVSPFNLLIFPLASVGVPQEHANFLKLESASENLYDPYRFLRKPLIKC